MTITQDIICRHIMKGRKLDVLTNEEVRVLAYFLQHEEEFYAARFIKGSQVVYDNLVFEGKLAKTFTWKDWYDILGYLEIVGVDGHIPGPKVNVPKLKRKSNMKSEIIELQDKLIKLLVNKGISEFNPSDVREYGNLRKNIRDLKDLLRTMEEKDEQKKV